MISEKGLVRAMKEAWRSAEGYMVAVSGGAWYIRAEDWAVIVPRGLLPRKCLALIVEHVGAIPEDGEAYTCTKRSGAQMVTAALMYEEKQELETMDKLRPAKRTSLTWGGYTLWQRAEDLRVLAIDENYSDIVSVQKQTNAFADAGNVIWSEKGVLARVRGAFIEPNAREYLSGMQWIG